jgi:hypothetical protein
VDSQIRGKPLVRSFHWLTLFMWPVSVPVYLIQTRGWRRLHWVALWIGGYVLAILLGFYLVSFVTTPSLQ